MATPYFLTCCRPILNPFCFLIEKPKLIDYYNYPFEYFLKHPLSGCKYSHENLLDHNLNIFNECTDDRAWSLDDRQKRQHFNDLISGRIPHCGPTGDRTEVKDTGKGKKPRHDSIVSNCTNCDLESHEDPKEVPVIKEEKNKEEKKEEGKKEEEKKKEEKKKEGKKKEDPKDVTSLPKIKSSSKGRLEPIEEPPSEEVSNPPEISSEEQIGERSSEKTAHPPEDSSEEQIGEHPLGEAPPPPEDSSEEQIGERPNEEAPLPPEVSSEEQIGERSSEKAAHPPEDSSEKQIGERSSEKTAHPPEDSSEEQIGEHPLGEAPLPSEDSSEEQIGERPSEEVPLHPEDSSEEHIGENPPEEFLLSPSEEKLLSEGKSKEYVPSVKSQEYQQIGAAPSMGSESSRKSGKSKQSGIDPKDVVGLTDELIEKLDRNLRNLESTFDKFVKKNRDFIQNLVDCLDFEKQKQKALEDDYNKLKQENEELKTQNDYLKMVNNKQLDLFKNELDRGITENKVIYKRKIHLMERQLQNDQNELKMYKQTEKQYMEVVEQDNEKIEKLNNKIDDLKNKEVQLVKNYLQLLKFLENVKNILSGADPKEIPQLRSLNTMTDSSGDNDPEVKRVLRDALTNGISVLNVRDLSILHDAIEGLNDSLCHQTDKCTKSPTADTSFPDFSSMSVHRITIEHSYENIPKQFEGYDTSSNLSIDKIPTRQKPEDRRVRFD